MKKSIIVICIATLIFCLWLLLHRETVLTKNSSPEIQAQLTNQLQANQSSSPQTEQPKAVKEPQIATVSGPRKIPSRPTQTEISNLQQQALAEWQKSIEFYGKVMDENSNAVEGANIQFRWSGLSDEVFTAATLSDGNGLFSLQGKQGRALDVSVSKEGYYSSHTDKTGFLYSLGPDIYSPDSLNPVVFHLQKKGQGVELITSQNGIRPNLAIQIPKDGTPVRIDFFQKQASATGQLEISQNKPPWQGATNWSFSLSISDGGLVENQDEFQFAAPESGYQPTVEYQFIKGEAGWTTQVTKQFYITFGQPRKYGWLRIESNLTQEMIFLTYAINPTGSQNLEPAQ